MVRYRHIFFDLDRTIWDFEKNSTETIFELLGEMGLNKKGSISENKFLEVYKAINQKLWKEYGEGMITKDQLRAERFYQSLLMFNVDERELALNFNNTYIERCSSKTNLVPYSKEILNYLASSHILHIITNGFTEAQNLKLEKSGIRPFFSEVIIADEIGMTKPDPRIFHHAIEASSADLNESIMIGDDFEADVLGAKNVGMDQVFYKKDASLEQKAEATFTIEHLSELKDIF